MVKKNQGSECLMPGSTNVPFEVSEDEFNMRLVNMVMSFSLATFSCTDRDTEQAKVGFNKLWGFLKGIY